MRRDSGPTGAGKSRSRRRHQQGPGATSITIIPRNLGQAGATLKVWVAGMGCSGFRYGMGIEDKEPEEGDQIFESNGVRLVIDPQSLSYMDGSLVTWVDEPDNSGFSIENPNPAPQTECNCGGQCSTSAEPCGCNGGSCDCGKSESAPI